ncbi:iron-containing alcohol dehydrogenase [Alkalibaculum sp. M08DMB]|uniref:Iron-containing alcohol dehydrogenase n=1 Tax=Alkalibaculum sporogenes TaxID=2655001 RepID=A0A6A7K8Y4_9FIRM|nr:iron-containing alcohol dehydrogenase [Alkalibaculum sporogenes]MPW25573.1 iron-containing alcohol dehydrogenase [Alkalibaculum sporogenes]
MKNFQYKMPTKLEFGIGSRNKLVDICKGLNATKVFILTGPNIVKTEIMTSIRSVFDTSDVDYEIYSEIVTDPPIDVVDKTAEILKKSQASVVVAVGGGSVIDTAKTICMLQTHEGSIKDYLFGGIKQVTKPCMPLICLPTTAGSGSEVTASAVITDKHNNIKVSVTHENLIPDVAIIDPELHMSMPQGVTASTGMDALTHAIEAYVSLNANPISDMNALYAIKLIGENLRTAVSNGNNLEARSNMALASTIAAAAFMNGGLGVIHGIAQSMGGVIPISHGLANAMILPYAMKRNFVGNLEKFKNISIALGKNLDGLSLREAALESIEGVFELAKDISLPLNLKDVGFKKEYIPEVIAGTMAYRLLAVNPCKLSAKDVENILLQAFE